MTFARDAVIGLVRAAFWDLSGNDHPLLTRDASERSITHKLGEYLWAHFRQPQTPWRPAEASRGQEPDYRVDCEYNRFGDEPKRIPLTYDLLAPDNECYYTPNPDVILHERGNSLHNVLVIEAKKEKHAWPPLVLLDKLKLVAYIGPPLHYSFGCYLCLDKGNQCVSIVDAFLIERTALPPERANERDSIWKESCELLFKDPTTPGRASLRHDLSKSDEQHATSLIQRIKAAHGFQDIRTRLLAKQ